MNIYIGGNSVVFECEINEQCTKMSRLWNVVNIEVPPHHGAAVSA